MKKLKALLSMIWILAILLAASISAYAIGFNAEDTYNSIFIIYSGNSLGSGFALGENCIISNAHVIENQDNITVVTYSGDKYRANIVAIDIDLDIVMLEVDNETFPYLSVADYNDTAIGEDVYTIGAPNSMTYTLTKGVLSAKNRAVGDYEYIQIDAAINAGNSGGPLLNDDGKVIGVNTLKMFDSEGIGLSIPMTTVIEFVKQQGIDIDDNGNVVGIVSSPAQSSERNNSNSAEDESSTEKVLAYSLDNKMALLILLGISVLLNIVLIIILVYRKKKNVIKNNDPSERTDFEIDILE